MIPTTFHSIHNNAIQQRVFLEIPPGNLWHAISSLECDILEQIRIKAVASQLPAAVIVSAVKRHHRKRGQPPSLQ